MLITAVSRFTPDRHAIEVDEHMRVSDFAEEVCRAMYMDVKPENIALIAQDGSTLCEDEALAECCVEDGCTVSIERIVSEADRRQAADIVARTRCVTCNETLKERLVQALTLDPDNVSAYSRLGIVVGEGSVSVYGREFSAVELYSRSVMLRPKDAVPYVNLASKIAFGGSIVLEDGECWTPKELLLHAIECDPYHYPSYSLLAMHVVEVTIAGVLHTSRALLERAEELSRGLSHSPTIGSRLALEMQDTDFGVRGYKKSILKGIVRTSTEGGRCYLNLALVTEVDPMKSGAQCPRRQLLMNAMRHEPQNPLPLLYLAALLDDVVLEGVALSTRELLSRALLVTENYLPDTFPYLKKGATALLEDGTFVSAGELLSRGGALQKENGLSLLDCVTGLVAKAHCGVIGNGALTVFTKGQQQHAAAVYAFVQYQVAMQNMRLSTGLPTEVHMREEERSAARSRLGDAYRVIARTLPELSGRIVAPNGVRMTKLSLLQWETEEIAKERGDSVLCP